MALNSARIYSTLWTVGHEPKSNVSILFRARTKLETKPNCRVFWRRFVPKNINRVCRVQIALLRTFWGKNWTVGHEPKSNVSILFHRSIANQIVVSFAANMGFKTAVAFVEWTCAFLVTFWGEKLCVWSAKDCCHVNTQDSCCSLN